ncbi:hypothetical protein [Saccharothrix coeruleofusca]|uniref:hypothetical protein n=1 Tax=Saccharothrix coeruleofusca TaxID=33919 RepID=UPI001E512637|nr:hypothetical protein [Saccharothrix coeruleofusca]
MKRAARQHVEQVRELVFDRLSHEQQRELREICEVLATGLTDEVALSRMGWSGK